MTVKELKELLEGFDEDLEVETYDGYWDSYFSIDEVKVTLKKNDVLIVELH